MVFACDHCKFLFSRTTEPEQCPDCGKFAVRAANQEEVADYQAIVEEFKRESA
ncbi:hypothetical protein RFF05_14280 [Bengtsoniella intestinalis]|uniref:hypothetical protein n=1 Tax=Bengtsoniella intestinalis TaxID=3073143 RepID=UPI00391F04B3